MTLQALRGLVASFLLSSLPPCAAISDECADAGAVPDATLFDRPTLFAFDEAQAADAVRPIFFARPGFTDPAKSLARGQAAVETGYSFIMDEADGERSTTSSFPEALVRVGILAEWLELRIGGNFTDTAVGSRDGAISGISGMNDLYLGAVVALTPQSGWWPETAVVPQLTIPTGDEAVSQRRTLPGVACYYNWNVGDRVGISGGTQVNRRIDDVDRDYLEVIESACVGYSVTELAGVYVEWFAFFPAGATVQAEQEHYADAGVAYLFTPNLQWDFQLGCGLNEAADDLFVGSGLSFGF